MDILKTLPDESIDCIMTSPPYWVLRDYETEKQIGLEYDFNDYINNLIALFTECKRILKKSGACWINIGDTYGGSGKGAGGKNTYCFKGHKNKVLINRESGFDYNWCFEKKPLINDNKYKKSLCLIPFRFSIAMLDVGWICRNVIIWHKPNSMPQSMKDRFTVDFEYLFFFVKNQKYWFKQQIEDYQSKMHFKTLKMKNKYMGKGLISNRDIINFHTQNGKNKRSIWTINTQPFAGHHFASYPEKLCEIPIKSTCPENGIVLDPFCGSGTTCITAKKLNRNYIGIDINQEYCNIAKERLSEVMPLFNNNINNDKVNGFNINQIKIFN